MAASVMVAVGGTDDIVSRVVEQARKLIPGETLGPVISAQARVRIERYVTDAEQAGARVLLDGRGVVVPGREGGFYMGATVLDGVTPEMRIARDEVFGPVLAIVRAETLDRGLEIEPRFADIAVRRWQAFTRRDAIHAVDDRTFDDLAAERVTANRRRPSRPTAKR